MNTIYYRMRKLSLLLFFLAQILFTVNAHDRGGYSFPNPPGASLGMLSGTIYGGGGPGGVAFEKTAVMSPDLIIESLKISYDANQPDGSRMILTINGKPVHYQLFDWELAPIAKFSNTPYVACFTYFGDLIDKNLEEVILANDGHIFNYHPDFSNTLIGWRLADMDLLIMYDFTTDLPKSEQNEYYLGAGEKIPDVAANETGVNNYLIHLNNIKNDLGYVFRSYVIGDFNQTVSVSVKNDSLNMTGTPYYYCWRFKQDFAGYNIQHAGDSVANRYQTILQQEKQKNPNFYERGLYIDSLISISEKYMAGYQFYESGTFVDMLSLQTHEAKRVFLEKYYTSDLKGMLIETAAYMDAYSAVYLKEFSDRMSGVPHMISAANPAVWHATVTTMQASAFFRYVKKNFPDEWQSFLNQVAQAQSKPDVKTPTVMYKTGNVTIENALRDYNAVAAPSVSINHEILFYPNPVNDILHIENLSGMNQISITSVTGKKRFNSVTGETQCNIQTGHLTPGFYVLQIRKNNQIILSKKIIKSGE